MRSTTTHLKTLAFVLAMLGVSPLAHAQTDAPAAPNSTPAPEMQEMMRHPPIVFGAVTQINASTLVLSVSKPGMPGPDGTIQPPETASTTVNLTRKTAFVLQAQRDPAEVMQEQIAFAQKVASASTGQSINSQPSLPFTESPITAADIAPGMTVSAMGAWKGDTFTATKVSEIQPHQPPNMPQ